jgi:ATP synthase protein I
MTTPEELQKRINKAEVENAPPPEASKESMESRRGGSAGMALVAALLVGAFLGSAFDGHFGTGPWGLLIFLFLGIASGFYTVYKATKGT